MSLIHRLIQLHEGLRLHPYQDTADPPRISIGYGRNLTDVGISVAEAEAMMVADVARVEQQLLEALPWARRLDPVRYAVLCDMGYNLGVPTLLTFHRTLTFVERGDYAAAAGAMLQSKWASQVGARARRLAAMMANGLVPPEVAGPIT